MKAGTLILEVKNFTTTAEELTSLMTTFLSANSLTTTSVLEVPKSFEGLYKIFMIKDGQLNVQYNSSVK